MSYFGALDISASGLTAQRLRMDTISQNIANVNTTKTGSGAPYSRKTVVFEERKIDGTPFRQRMSNSEGMDGKFGSILKSVSKEALIGDGVRVSNIVADNAPFKKVYDPGHPDADADGYVSLPNVEVVTEMVNMISASRAYEANVTSINTPKSIAMKALEIGR